MAFDLSRFVVVGRGPAWRGVRIQGWDVEDSTAQNLLSSFQQVEVRVDMSGHSSFCIGSYSGLSAHNS